MSSTVGLHPCRREGAGPPGPACPRQLDNGRRCVGEVVWSVLWRLVLRWLPNPFNPLRVACLRLFGAQIPFSVFVDRRARILCPANLRIGPHCHLAHGVILDCAAGITIGEGTRVSQYSHLTCDTCDESCSPVRVCRKPITIGREVWLAADVYVAGGVTVGEGAVLGARASVFEDVPPNMLALGSPAHVVAPRHAPWLGDRPMPQRGVEDQATPADTLGPGASAG